MVWCAILTRRREIESRFIDVIGFNETVVGSLSDAPLAGNGSLGRDREREFE